VLTGRTIERPDAQKVCVQFAANHPEQISCCAILALQVGCRNATNLKGKLLSISEANALIVDIVQILLLSMTFTTRIKVRKQRRFLTL
jgi:hypothetical protein